MHACHSYIIDNNNIIAAAFQWYKNPRKRVLLEIFGVFLLWNTDDQIHP